MNKSNTGGFIDFMRRKILRQVLSSAQVLLGHHKPK